MLWTIGLIGAAISFANLVTIARYRYPRIVHTPARTPRANASIQRFLGSGRREWLDHSSSWVSAICTRCCPPM